MTAAPKDLIAYFSMEIALASEIPTYSGGLGVLAGDTLRSAADMGLPMVGMTLLYRKGYFRQVLDSHGHQTEKDVVWSPELHLERLNHEVVIHIQGRDLRIGVHLARALLRPLTPDEAAATILRGAAAGRREVVFPRMLAALYYANALAPWLVRWLTVRTGYRR